jgi:hypothetical protein
MRLVVGDVAIVKPHQDRHSAILADGQLEEELPQIR